MVVTHVVSGKLDAVVDGFGGRDLFLVHVDQIVDWQLENIRRLVEAPVLVDVRHFRFVLFRVYINAKSDIRF